MNFLEGGMKTLWISFGHHKTGLALGVISTRIHFKVFSYKCTEWGYLGGGGVVKISNIFVGMRDIPGIFYVWSKPAFQEKMRIAHWGSFFGQKKMPN